MVISKRVWFIVSILLIGVILLVDPRTDMSPGNRNRLNLLFSSRTKQEKLFRKFMWALIFMFYFTTLLSSYGKLT